MSSMDIDRPNVPNWGIDLQNDRRPGVPREVEPSPYPGAHWTTPEEQEPTAAVEKRADLPALTPVFGTSAPVHGLSGIVRRAAYAIPDHLVRHWLLLLAADRIDALESAVTGAFTRRREPKPAPKMPRRSEAEAT